MKKSSIVSHLAHEGKLKIAAGEYMLDSGKVEMIELPKTAAKKEKSH
jgi:hypothetical protein